MTENEKQAEEWLYRYYSKETIGNSVESLAALLDTVERKAREAGRKACERKWQRAMADVARAEKLRRG